MMCGCWRRCSGVCAAGIALRIGGFGRVLLRGLGGGCGSRWRERSGRSVESEPCCDVIDTEGDLCEGVWCVMWLCWER